MEKVRKDIKNDWDKDGFDSMLFDWMKWSKHKKKE